VLYVGPSECELARTIHEGGFGIAVRVDDPAALAGAIRTLQADPARRAAMERAAAHWAHETGGLAAALTRWEELLGPSGATGDATDRNVPPKSRLP
jgi:hypothetical protein